MQEYVSKNLIKILDESKEKPTQMVDDICAKVWQSFGGDDLVSECNLVSNHTYTVDTSDVTVPNSMLVQLPKYRATINDLAAFIRSSVTGNSDKKEERIATLDYWGSTKSPFEKLPVLRPRKALQGLIDIVKQGKGKLIDTEDDNDIAYLADYLAKHEDLVSSKQVDLVPLVLSSAAAKSLNAIKDKDFDQADIIEEYEKDLRPLVYGLIQTETFTSNKGMYQTAFSNNTFLSTKNGGSNVQDQIIACLKQDGFDDDLIKKYFHNLSVVSHLYDVDSSADSWNGNVANRKRNSLVTIADDNDRLEPLSNWEGFEFIKNSYNNILVASGKTTSSLANASTVKNIYNELVKNVRENAELQDKKYKDDVDYAALAFARVLAGVAKAKSTNILREAQQDAASWKKMYNARVTRDGRKEQIGQPEAKQTNETRGNAKNAQRNAEKNKDLVFFKGHTELTDKQRQLALKYISGNSTVMLTELGKILGLSRSELNELNPREVVSKQAIENLIGIIDEAGTYHPGYLKAKGATREEALHIAHYYALPVILWTPEATIKEVKKLNEAKAVAQENAQETEFQKMLRPIIRLSDKINNERTAKATIGTFWTDLVNFANDNAVRFDELNAAINSENPYAAIKDLLPESEQLNEKTQKTISRLVKANQNLPKYQPVTQEHQEKVVKNFVKARACVLIPDVKNAYDRCLVSTKLFKDELEKFAGKYNLNKSYLVKTLYPTLDQKEPYYGEIETLLEGVDEGAKEDLNKLLDYSGYQMDDLLAYCQALEQHIDINKTLSDVKSYIDGTEKVDAKDIYDIICDNLNVRRPARKVVKQAAPAKNELEPIEEVVNPIVKAPKAKKSVEQQFADLAKKRAKLTQQYKNLLDENDLTDEQGDAVQNYVDNATTAGKPIKTQVVKDLLSVSEETKMLYDLYSLTYGVWHDFIAVAQENGFSSKAAVEICKHFYENPQNNMQYNVGSKKVTPDKIRKMRTAALSYIETNKSLVETINGLNQDEETKKQVKNLLLKNLDTKKPVDIIKLQKLLSDQETV